jgi:hypothetical protein
MVKIKPILPEREECKLHILKAFHEYFISNQTCISELPVFEKKNIQIEGALKLVEVSLPDWGASCGINGLFLVPVETVLDENSKDWKSVDWWMAAFILLEAWHERVYEYENGSIQSYSFRLKNWDTRAWDYAWVNRIALFLILWANQENTITKTLNPIPLKLPSILMTHDVDAISKTFPIRIKQFVFNIFNFFISLKKGDWKISISRLKKAFTFLLSNENWWKLDEVLQIEENAEMKSVMNFYSDDRGKSFKRWLFDPSYNIKNKKVIAFIKKITERDFIVGIHPGYDSWNNQQLMDSQVKSLSKEIDYDVIACRQHWLRFSWGLTWQIQFNAGIKLDTTLMFNDRPGFRVSAVLKYHPWDHVKNDSHQILTLPTVMMDSHFYDYSLMSDIERETNMSEWIEEIKKVQGDSAVLWHPHTLSSDYGWKNGFLHLLKLIK